MADPRTPEPRATPADIAEMTRYATESRPPALRELEEATQCRCDVAWTSRNLHETHCLAYLRSEVEALYRAAYQAGREAAALAIEAVQPGGDDAYRLTAAKWRHAFATVARGGNVPQDTQPSDLDALIRDLVAITSCWPYPDGGGCQAHKWVEDRPCPHLRAREYLAQQDAQDGDADG